MSYSERKNRDFFPLLVSALKVFIFIFLLPSIQELPHWFLLLGVCIWVVTSDVDYGVIMAFP